MCLQIDMYKYLNIVGVVSYMRQLRKVYNG